MKITNLLCAASVVVLSTSAFAQTQINIGGATAFRAAAHSVILAGFTSVQYAYTAAAVGDANQAIFVGNYTGITGTTTIRTSFTGSIAGIQSLVQGNTINFLPTNTTVSSSPGTTVLAAAANAPIRPKFGFSDSEQNSTPFRSPILVGGPVGVVVFAMVANEGAPNNLTNVTSQQFRALWTQGFQPLSLFTGNPADSKFVYATGRNDGSGTRTTYMAESGLGIPTLVNQWRVAGAGNANTALRLWPANDGVNRSTVWGQDVDGNGGYNSGSSINTLMGRTSSAVTVEDPAGNDVFGTPQDVVIMSWVSSTDAATGAAAGGRILAFNGSSITPTATTSLSTTDINKVAYGQYTAWSFQQFLYHGTLSAQEATFRTNLISGLNNQALLLNNGIAIATMAVSRAQDGGTVAP